MITLQKFDLVPGLSRALTAICVTCWLVGCSSVGVTPPTTSSPPAEIPPEESIGPAVPSSQDPAPSTTDTASNSAALLLLAQSDDLRTDGKHPQAIALVERAIRLEPRNGTLWVQLGRLNFEQGEFAQAEQYARRGIALAGTKPAAKRDGWLLLADISDARGDIEGAEQIRSRWINARG